MMPGFVQGPWWDVGMAGQDREAVYSSRFTQTEFFKQTAAKIVQDNSESGIRVNTRMNTSQ
jgi:hypothetical protein